jgi:hypothetical protein
MLDYDDKGHITIEQVSYFNLAVLNKHVTSSELRISLSDTLLSTPNYSGLLTLTGFNLMLIHVGLTNVNKLKLLQARLS